jgi:hypothetical protein
LVKRRRLADWVLVREIDLSILELADKTKNPLRTLYPWRKQSNTDIAEMAHREHERNKRISGPGQVMAIAGNVSDDYMSRHMPLTVEPFRFIRLPRHGMY